MSEATTHIYQVRAANREKPSDWAPPHVRVYHTRDEGMALAAAGQTFTADCSVYQPVVNSQYPYPVFIWRADTGFKADTHCAANWSYVEHNPTHIQVGIIYSVFIPGQSAAILARLKNQFGARCPTMLAPMIDMESGKQFAGPGNHSAEANDFAGELAAWGSEDKVLGYANGSDWGNCWSNHPVWMKRSLARYSSDPTPAGYWARQYYGALNYPVPHGWPTSCAPFGSFVDMNEIPLSITQILLQLGMTQPAPAPVPAPTPTGDDDGMTPNQVIYEVDQTTAPAGTAAIGTWLLYTNTNVYIHIDAAVGKTVNVATLITGGAVNAGPITYQQHLDFLAAAPNKTAGSTS